jgi:hypothetical protein
VTESAPEGPGQWLGGRRWTGVVAAAVLLIMVLAVLTWSRSQGDAPPPAAAPTAVVPTGSTVPGVKVNNGDRAIPTSAPTDVTWQVWHAIALPFSATAGPSRVDGQVASGFAHTPTGALVAYAQASSRFIAATDPGWQDVYTTMIAPGPGRDENTTAREKLHLTGMPTPGSFAQFAGFRFISYAPTEAVIQIASKDPNGPTYVAVVAHMTWLDGDWKWVLPPSDAPSTKQALATLSGFVPWGSV